MTVEAGFTTVRDVGSFRAFVDCRAARRDRRAATSSGRGCSAPARSSPRRGAAATSSAWPTTSGLPDDLRFGVVTSADEVRERVRRLLIGGADLIKCIGTGAVLTRGGVPGAPELSEDELRAAVEEAALLRRVRRRPRALRPRARSGRSGPAPAPSSTARCSTTRRSRCSPTPARSYSRRPVRRRVGARARRRASAGRPTRCASSRETHGRRGEAAFRRRDRAAASGSRTGPTAACTPTSSSAKGLDAFVRWGMTPIGADPCRDD